MSPSVPYRHPARSSRSKTSQSSRQASLSDEYLDVWEHATLLYHGFEWQSAAETFLMLSRQINIKLESTLCLLNAAIVFSRLGDFATAAQILEEAEPEGDLLPLTMFVLGHVEFEQGNFEKSEGSFRVALQFLNGPTQCYDRYGLDFTLRTSHIQQILRIFQTKNNLFGILGTIGAIPADGIFEAPSRPYGDGAISPIMSQASTDSDDVPPLSEVSSPSSVTTSPIEARYEDPSGDLWVQVPRQDTGNAILRHMNFAEDTNALKTKSRVLPIKNSREPIGSRVRTLSQNQVPSIVPPRKSRYEPRDARVRGDSVGSLASFIRQLPSQNKMEPRSDGSEGRSTKQLAEFLKASPRSRPSPYIAGIEQGNSSDSLKADSIVSVDLVAEKALTRRSDAGLTALPIQPAPEQPSSEQSSSEQSSSEQSSSKRPALSQASRSRFGSFLGRDKQHQAASEAPTPSTPQSDPVIGVTNMYANFLRVRDATRDSKIDRTSTRSFAYTDEIPAASQRSSFYSQRTESRPGSVKGGVAGIHPALRPDMLRRSSSILGNQTPPQQLQPPTLHGKRLQKPNMFYASRSSSSASKANSAAAAAKPPVVAAAQPSRPADPKQDLGYARYFGRFGSKMKK